jgi:uncharacterized protein (DUF983 family)
MKTTDCQIFYKGEATPADAHGNNIAWCCAACGHPLLFVCRDNQKGFGGKATQCHGCGKSYTIHPQGDKAFAIEALQ